MAKAINGHKMPKSAMAMAVVAIPVAPPLNQPDQYFNELDLIFIYLFGQQHWLSHRVDLKSASGVVGGIDCFQSNMSAPFASR